MQNFDEFFREYCVKQHLNENAAFSHAIRRHMEAAWVEAHMVYAKAHLITKKDNTVAQKKCCVCERPAMFVRCTQFAGDHPYCEEHARFEEDFPKGSGDDYWVEVSNESY